MWVIPRDFTLVGATICIMSVLTGKHVAVVGAPSAQLERLGELLAVHEVTTTEIECASLTPEFIETNDIDLILVNQLDGVITCADVLTQLQQAEWQKLVPIFVLVENNEAAIETAFALGATDYLTPDETPESILRKFAAIFTGTTEPTNIDITPPETSIEHTNIRVFVLEDDPLLRNLLSIRFDRSGFPYEFSSDGSTAVSSIEQFKPDVIILDLMLPGHNGLDILERVKAHPALKTTPVVVFSNRDGTDERARAKALGVNGFYVKAMTDLSELIETIETLATDPAAATTTSDNAA